MAKQLLPVAIFLICLELCCADGNILCATRVGTINLIIDDGKYENVSSETTQLKCDYCFTLWQEGENASESVIMGQGMFDLLA